jgi:hypothetical protein
MASDFTKGGGAARSNEETAPPPVTQRPSAAKVTPAPKTPYSHLRDRLGHPTDEGA